MKSLLAMGFMASALILSSARRFDSAKVFRVKPHKEKQVNFLKNLPSNLQIDFWYPDSALHILSEMEVDFHVSADQAKYVETLLKQNGIPYEILFQNLQEDIEKQLDNKNKSTSKYHYTKYNEWHQISAWTARIAKKYPKLVSRIKIGNTFENRSMYLLKIGKQRNPKKAIFMDCGIHAREWISPAFCQWFVKEATRTYGKDGNMTNILDNMNFYVVPLFNIDGYVWSWTQNRFWRKNRSNASSSTCIGVDLNRNFDAAWGTIDASKNPCEEIYCGSSPESEPETKAVTTFIRSHLSSIKAYLTIHSYSQMLLFPYGYTYDKTPNYKELKELAREAAKAIASLYGKKYTYGTSAATIYPSSGCSDDWAYDQGIKYSFTFELRDKGKHGFLLPESEIKATCQEIMLAVKFLANYILRKI
ncbi:mast cell carboxypeptidase A-like [Sceloporus undulatus]|uniref:mast cell carboxypeptidase A-like n=1 Tax=Sceloporus undulatus TaxID=8520 RepID=UPI001C4D2B59|nr:mast cell carboxypeptidase A-like [Sceloporus undulatus]